MNIAKTIVAPPYPVQSTAKELPDGFPYFAFPRRFRPDASVSRPYGADEFASVSLGSRFRLVDLSHAA